MAKNEKKDRYQNMLDMIGALESNNDYNIMYGERTSTNNLTGMTVDDVLALQENLKKERGKSAAGKYQIINSTLKGLKDKLKLKGDELFNEDMQDNMAISLLDGRGYEKYLRGEISQEEFITNVTKEWEALPKTKDAIGRKAYVNLDGSDTKLTTLDYKTFQDILSKSKGTKEEVKNTDFAQIEGKSTTSLLDGLKPPGSIDLNTFNFGIKKEGSFGEFKLNGEADTTNPVGTKSDDYLNSIQQNQGLGTALEVGKLGANLAAYLRNSRTEAPEGLKAGTIPLLSKNFMNADYSQIDQDIVRMLGASREAGGTQANLSPLLRAGADAKTKLGATVNQFNLQEKARVEATNLGIMEKNILTKLGVDQYNRETNLKLGEAKGRAQTALMQGMFDNATNMAAYREKAATSKEEYRRALADEAIRLKAATYGNL